MAGRLLVMQVFQIKNPLSRQVIKDEAEMRPWKIVSNK